MSPYPNNVLLLNRSCYPNCSICAPDIIEIISFQNYEKVLEAIRLSSKEVYVGAEAFKDLDLLRRILTACKEKELNPILLTRGKFAQKEEDIKKILSELLKYADFKLLIIADKQHLDVLGYDYLGVLIKSIRMSLHHGVPEMLYLIQEGETIPLNLLKQEEANKYLAIHCRKAKNLMELIEVPNNTYNEFLSKVVCPERTKLENTQSNDSLIADTKSLLNRPEEYPFLFNALVFETTYLCNARCKHCYLSCGPDASSSRMPVAKAKQIIEEASHLANIRKHFHIGGGESTIFWDEMIEILEYAKDNGFVNSIVTNGFWGLDYNQAVFKVNQLKDMNVCEIEFSVDAMHGEFVPHQAISNIIYAAKEAKIKIILRMCTTKAHTAAELLKNIGNIDLNDVVIAISKVVPVGRAKSDIPLEELWVDPGIPVGACSHSLNLTVAPNGDVFPCCVGSESCKSLRLGNCFEQSLKTIMKSSRGNFLLRALVSVGPAYYAALIQQTGIGHKLLSNYSNYCHLCNQIFTDPELYEVVAQIINRKVLDSLIATLADEGIMLKSLGQTTEDS
jgi:MoaA/NifB/PqqE/SkfB family radical SAM enzyme